MYHQARVLQAKGDKAKAIELLKDVAEARDASPGESHPFSYLEFVVEDRLRELDPDGAAAQGAQAMSGGRAGPGGAGAGRAGST